MDIRLSSCISVIILAFLSTNICPVQGQWGLNFGWFWGDMKLPNAKSGSVTNIPKQEDGDEPRKIRLHSGWLFRKSQSRPDITSSEEESESVEISVKQRKSNLKKRIKSRLRMRQRKSKISNKLAKRMLKRKLRKIYRSRLNKVRRNKKQDTTRHFTRLAKRRNNFDFDFDLDRESETLKTRNNAESTDTTDIPDQIKTLRKVDTRKQANTDTTDQPDQSETLEKGYSRNLGNTDTTGLPDPGETLGNGYSRNLGNTDTTDQPDPGETLGKGYSRNLANTDTTDQPDPGENLGKGYNRNPANTHTTARLNQGGLLGKGQNQNQASDTIRNMPDPRKHFRGISNSKGVKLGRGYSKQDPEYTEAPDYETTGSNSRSRAHLNRQTSITKTNIKEIVQNNKNIAARDSESLPINSNSRKNLNHKSSKSENIGDTSYQRRNNQAKGGSGIDVIEARSEYNEINAERREQQSYRTNSVDPETPERAGPEHTKMKTNQNANTIVNVKKNKYLGSRRNVFGDFRQVNRSTFKESKIPSTARTSVTESRKPSSIPSSKLHLPQPMSTVKTIERKQSLRQRNETQRHSNIGSNKVYTFDVVNKNSRPSSINDKVFQKSMDNFGQQTLRNTNSGNTESRFKNVPGKKKGSIDVKESPQSIGRKTTSKSRLHISSKELSQAHKDNIKKLFIGNLQGKGRSNVSKNQRQLQTGMETKPSHPKLVSEHRMKDQSPFNKPEKLNIKSVETKEKNGQLQRLKLNYSGIFGSSLTFGKSKDINMERITRKPAHLTKMNIVYPKFDKSEKAKEKKSKDKDNNYSYDFTSMKGKSNFGKSDNNILDGKRKPAMTKSHKDKFTNLDKSQSKQKVTSGTTGEPILLIAKNIKKKPLKDNSESKKARYPISEGYTVNKTALKISNPVYSDISGEKTDTIVNPKPVTTKSPVSLPAQVKVQKKLSQKELTNSHQRIKKKSEEIIKKNVNGTGNEKTSIKNTTLSKIYKPGSDSVYSFQNPSKKKNDTLTMELINKTVTKVWSSKTKGKPYLKKPTILKIKEFTEQPIKRISIANIPKRAYEQNDTHMSINKSTPSPNKLKSTKDGGISFKMNGGSSKNNSKTKKDGDTPLEMNGRSSKNKSKTKKNGEVIFKMNGGSSTNKSKIKKDGEVLFIMSGEKSSASSSLRNSVGKETKQSTAELRTERIDKSKNQININTKSNSRLSIKKSNTLQRRDGKQNTFQATSGNKTGKSYKTVHVGTDMTDISSIPPKMLTPFGLHNRQANMKNTKNKHQGKASNAWGNKGKTSNAWGNKGKASNFWVNKGNANNAWGNKGKASKAWGNKGKTINVQSNKGKASNVSENRYMEGNRPLTPSGKHYLYTDSNKIGKNQNKKRMHVGSGRNIFSEKQRERFQQFSPQIQINETGKKVISSYGVNSRNLNEKERGAWNNSNSLNGQGRKYRKNLGKGSGMPYAMRKNSKNTDLKTPSNSFKSVSQGAHLNQKDTTPNSNTNLSTSKLRKELSSRRQTTRVPEDQINNIGSKGNKSTNAQGTHGGNEMENGSGHTITQSLIENYAKMNEQNRNSEENESDFEYADEETEHFGSGANLSAYTGGSNVFTGSWMNEVREDDRETANEMEGDWKDLNVTVVGGKNSSCPAYRMRYLDNAVVIDTVENKCRIIVTWNKRQVRERVKERLWWGFSVYNRTRTVYAPVVTHVDLR